MVELGTTIDSPITGERLTFLSTADSSDGALLRAELVVQPNGYVVRSHTHPNQKERFVVLEGRYGWRIGNVQDLVFGPLAMIGTRLGYRARYPQYHVRRDHVRRAAVDGTATILPA